MNRVTARLALASWLPLLIEVAAFVLLAGVALTSSYPLLSLAGLGVGILAIVASAIASGQR